MGTPGDAEGAGAERRGAPPASALPCLYSNNSTEECSTFNKLTGAHKRTAHILAHEIGELGRQFGIERLGFLTLTFSDHVTAIREASRRFNSLATHVLKARYVRCIGAVERQRSKRLHFHLLTVMACDIRTGVDFRAFAARDYRTASLALRSEWAFWRVTAPRYGFGRTELLPVRSTIDGIRRYVGKYIAKHISERDELDKGARLVRYIGFGPGDRRGSLKFSWNSDGSWLWRHKVAEFCKGIGFEDTIALRETFGPRWAYFLQSEIFATPLPAGTLYPSRSAAERAFGMEFRREVLLDQASKVTEGRKCSRDYVLNLRPKTTDENGGL